MSEDIDIEEHDLLDNPMLKKIFPDLSILKKEIDENLYEASMEDFKSTFSNKKDDSNKGPNEHTITSEVKRDIFKSTPSSVLNNKEIINSNKIILGSKPTKIQHKKTFQQQVKLVISDIGPYLERSKKYCKECFTLFSDKIKFDAHMESTHVMKICSSPFMKIENKTKLTRLPKCNICHTSFSSRGALKIHYGTKHKRDTKKTRREIGKAINMPLNEKSKSISKHFCSHCQKLFPSVNALIGHMYEIFNVKKNKMADQGLGKSGQAFGNSALDQQVIKAYICPFCFYYIRTAKHYFCHMLKKHNMTQVKNIKKIPVKLNCKQCHLNFENIKAYNSHIYKSHLKSAGPKLNDIKEKKNTSKVILSKTPPGQLAQSFAYKSILFKCSLCDVHFLSAYTATKHLNHLEVLIHWKCNVCERIFKKNDELYHKTQHIYTDEFNVYDLDSTADLKVLFKCSQCIVHFTEENYLLHSSRCGTTQSLSTYCFVCHILIDKATMKSHKYSHDYKKYQKDHYIIIDPKGVIMSSNESENTLSAASTVSNNNHMSQLKNLITKDLQCAMPNIIFLCKNCNYAADSYDKTVQHCQEYCQSIIEIITIKCKICNFKFCANDYVKHQQLHDKNQWNSNLLKVLTYDKAYFLSENEIWTQHLFSALPNKEMIKEHIETSIYRYEHRIKLRILQDGPIELIAFKCEKCCRFIDPLSLFKHSDSCTANSRRHPCSFCGLPFISVNSKKNHEKIHQISNVGLKSLKIISFNSDEDAIFNKKIIASYNQHVLFQCRMCNVVINKGEVDKHKLKCNNYALKKCYICGLLIYQSDYKSHISKHQTLKSFNENSIKIVLFGKRNDKGYKLSEQFQPTFRGMIIDYTFYKCSKCAISFSDEKSTLGHSCDFSVSHSKCPKCPIYLHTINLHEHLKMHERDREFRQENIDIIKFDVVKSHEQLLNEDLKLKKSPVVCIKRETNLIINKKTSLRNNITESVKCPFLNHENVSSKNNTNESNRRDLSTIVEKEIDIFKCCCGLHYLDKDSATKHVANCNSNSKTCKQTCSKCGLLFTPDELFSHVLLHHGDKFMTYKYNVIEIFVKDDITKC